MILAGDLGGTKTLLCEYDWKDGILSPVRQAAYPSQSAESFEVILHTFLSGRTRPPIRRACFGVAGTVVNGRCQTTNLPWFLEEHALAVTIGAERVKLLNDLEATAYGMLSLPEEVIAVLSPGDPNRSGHTGNVGVIAAGTGLGEAMLYWDGTQHHPIASEGGHADFGPRTELEVDLWHYLHHHFGGHVSYERVLSGPGFLNIYAFLKESGRHPEPAWLAETLREGNPNAVISEHGIAGDDPLCAATVSTFAAIYGAEAGNLALRSVAVGGVFLGGGIAPKLLPALKTPAFLDSFVDKGRFSDFLKGIKISVSLDPQTALLGAAHYATRS